jgi:hypothetical protein
MEKGNELRISESLALPLDIVTDTIGILAIKGSGKTYAFLTLVEEMVKRNLPAVVIDTMGVCWGLRSSVDGKSPGLPIVILGGVHGDVPLESTAGKVIADWIVGERQPAVLDISEFTKGEASRFILDFLTRLFQTNRSAMHLFIDEADEWAPQRPFREEARTLRAMEVLVRRGRARGIGVTLVTQRPATLSKNVLTQVGALVVGRMISPQDRKAVQAWIDAHGTEHQKETFWESLASLSTKDKWIWAPTRDIFKCVTIRLRETFDSSATPRVGEKVSAPKSLAEVDLEKLKGRIAATIERAKQEDPRELRKQLAEARRQISELQSGMGRSTEKVEVPVEIPVLKDGQITRLEKIVENLRTISGKLSGPIDQMAKHGISITEAIKKYSSKPAILPQKIETKINPVLISKRIIKEEGDEPPRTLRSGERRMLDVLCRWYPARLTKAQIATLSRLRVTSGTFSNYYGTLKRANLINEDSNGIQASDLGFRINGGVRSAPQTTDEIIQMWRGALRAGERRLLDILVEIYPKGISRSELAERTELTANAGTFGNYFGTLRRNGLAEVSGDQVRAGEVLFLQR